MMQNYKIIIQYEGGRFQGWQRQTTTDNTIQGKMEAILSKMCNAPIEINGAGRTDAGVHAKGQVANFKINTDKSPAEIMRYLNMYLPEDIAVTEISKVDERFHSRLSAKEKIYCYRILNAQISDVFTRRFVYKMPAPLNIEKMQKAAECFVGEHNFRAFCNTKTLKKSSVREIYSLSVEKVGEEVRLTFRGNGFLYNMVRIITGTLIEVGLGKRSAEEIPAIIESRDRQKAGETAPARGLTLMEVIY